jgi:hypothetical protein
LCLFPAKVLDGNVDAAALLAKVVHERIQVAPHIKLTTLEAEIPTERIGVWIDPIGGYPFPMTLLHHRHAPAVPEQIASQPPFSLKNY